VEGDHLSVVPADEGDRDRLADECALLADECAELRDIVMQQRALLEIKERDLARAQREISALELERAELVRRLTSNASPTDMIETTDAGTASGEHERAGSLVLGLDHGEQRHFLLGHVVHIGDLLELCTVDGMWIVGRYDWSAHATDLPKLCGAIASVEIPIAVCAQLRWPATPVCRRLSGLRR
jgi:hypothetical protein